MQLRGEHRVPKGTNAAPNLHFQHLPLPPTPEGALAPPLEAAEQHSGGQVRAGVV